MKQTLIGDTPLGESHLFNTMEVPAKYLLYENISLDKLLWI